MNDKADDPWRIDEADYPATASAPETLRFLLRYAVLAPSSHNTQPWTFAIGDRRIDVHVDPAGWLEIADADRRELFLSVGCALENLVVAAERFGFAPVVEHVAEAGTGTLVARVRLEERGEGYAPSRSTGLFEAIPRRHTNHGAYDDRPVPDEVRRDLEALAVEDGLAIHFTDDPEVRRRVEQLTVRADAVQFADPAWREELGAWMRRGVFGAGWLMSKISGLAVSYLDLSGTVGKKDRDLLRSAPLLGLVAADRVTRESRVRSGQLFERMFLKATDAGLALQPMNQILQVAETREAFEALLPDAWGTPQITFRLGYADPEEHTPRRPLESYLR